MDTHTENMINNMMTAISQLGLEEFVTNFNDDGGFMWSQDKRVTDIGNHELVDSDGHSGASFAITLRHCQARLREKSKNANIDCCCCHEKPESEESPVPVLKTIEPLGDFNVRDNIRLYANTELMDDNNKKAMEVLETQGLEESIKHMLTAPNGQQRSYAQMRELYG